MALQTGPEGNVLIDSSFATAVPRILEAIAAAGKDAPYVLINTHWHFDHTDGNEGLHSAGFTIYAHRKTRERLSTAQTMKMFHVTMPPSPAGALPVIALAVARAPSTHWVNASLSSGGMMSVMLPSTASALWLSASTAGPSVASTLPALLLKAST